MQNLADGLESVQRSKDETIIEDLMARRDGDEEEDYKPTVSLLGKGETVRFQSGPSLSIAGIGIQAGLINKGLGVFLEYSDGRSSGTDALKGVKRSSLGLFSQFQAKALESLIWTLELGAGTEKTVAEAKAGNEQLEISGIHISYRLGIGLRFTDHFTIDFGPMGSQFYEQDRKEDEGLSSLKLKPSFLNGAYARLNYTL